MLKLIDAFITARTCAAGRLIVYTLQAHQLCPMKVISQSLTVKLVFKFNDTIANPKGLPKCSKTSRQTFQNGVKENFRAFGLDTSCETVMWVWSSNYVDLNLKIWKIGLQLFAPLQVLPTLRKNVFETWTQSCYSFKKSKVSGKKLEHICLLARITSKVIHFLATKGVSSLLVSRFQHQSIVQFPSQQTRGQLSETEEVEMKCRLKQQRARRW